MKSSFNIFRPETCCSKILTTDEKHDLFIGNLPFASNFNASEGDEMYELCGDHSLKKYNIRYVLSVTTNDPSIDGEYKKNGIETLRFEIEDDKDADLAEILPKCLEFVEESLKKGNVLVHCDIGMSRSGSVCVAFVMKRLELSLHDSLKFCKERRGIIEPNEGFIEQLKMFEKDQNK